MMYQVTVKEENQKLLATHLNWLKETGLIENFELRDSADGETKDFLTKVIEKSEEDFKHGKNIFQ